MRPSLSVRSAQQLAARSDGVGMSSRRLGRMTRPEQPREAARAHPPVSMPPFTSFATTPPPPLTSGRRRVARPHRFLVNRTPMPAPDGDEKRRAGARQPWPEIPQGAPWFPTVHSSRSQQRTIVPMPHASLPMMAGAELFANHVLHRRQRLTRQLVHRACRRGRSSLRQSRW
jgi:hypothetical protein